MIEVVVDEVMRALEKATNEGMRAADDYTDADTGLLMCGQCRTKKQKKISFLGEERIVGCLCRCAAEKLEKEREEYRVKEELLNIQKMKSAELQDRTFYNYTFDRCDASRENAIYVKAVCGTFFRNGADRAGTFVLGECRDRQDIPCRVYCKCAVRAENPCTDDKFSENIKCTRRSLQFGAE